MQRFDTSSFWNYVSDFFQLLDERSRDKVEYMWEGMATAYAEMDVAANRFIAATDPEAAATAPVMGIYNVHIDIAKSMPLPVDVADPGSRSIFVPKRIISNPGPGGRNDRIVVERNIYDAFVDSVTGLYAIVNDGVTTKYFKVIGVFAVDGVYAFTVNGDLSYIKNPRPQVSISNGRKYAISEDIIDLPWLRTTVMDGGGTTFFKDKDYALTVSAIEFFTDVVGTGVIDNDSSVFCENVPVMEMNLFTSWGSLVGIRDWRGYAFDNISAKTAISVMMQAVQDPSNRTLFERALSVLLGLPIAPENSVVIGVYDSFDYNVIDVDGNNITFEIVDITGLHRFIQAGTKMVISGTDTEIDVVAVVDRMTWTITVADASAVAVNSKLNIRLHNQMPITQVSKAGAGYNSVFAVGHWVSDCSDIQHLVNNLNTAPVFFIKDNAKYGGSRCYHISATSSSGIACSDDWSTGDAVPLYNDFVVDGDTLAPTTVKGSLHIPWPTHKYILLRFNSDNSLYKCYIDSQFDTVVESGDAIDKYQVLGHGVNLLNDKDFPRWNEYDAFDRYNGLDLGLNALEMVWTIPGSSIGINFPN